MPFDEDSQKRSSFRAQPRNLFPRFKDFSSEGAPMEHFGRNDDFRKFSRNVNGRNEESPSDGMPTPKKHKPKE